MRTRSAVAPAAIAAVIALASWSPTLGVEQGRKATIRDWQARLEQVREQLDAGRFTEARTGADDLTAELVRRLGGGEDDARLLAAVVTYRAIAEAALGQEEDAAWSWITVQNLDPAMRDAPLEALGRAGEVFARHLLRRPGEIPPGAIRVDGPGDDVQPRPPVPIEVVLAKPPSLDLVPAWRREALRVEIVIDETGAVRAPLVVEPEKTAIPGKIVVGLEALRRWRFRPAVEDDRPVKAVVTLDPWGPPNDLAYKLATAPKLQPIHELALSGRWSETWDRARAVLAAESDRCLAGDVRSSDCQVGALAFLRAVAAAGAGDGEDAAWYWAVALSLTSGLMGSPLGFYGPPGIALEELPTACRFLGEECSALRLRRTEPGITSPRKLAGDPPPLPPTLAEIGGDRVVVRTVIGSDGRPREPHVLVGRHPAAGFLALEALSGWRFEPARRDGEPVDVVVELTVPFAPEAPGEQVEAWRQSLEELDRGLRAADWDAVAPLAGALVDEIAAAAGAGGSDLLARAVAGAALAAAGRGSTDDAIWDWHLAQNLAYELRWADLSAYGAAGELLAAHPLRFPGELAAGTLAPLEDEPEFGSLRRTGGAAPVYPERYRDTTPVVQIVVGDGRPGSPVVLSVDPPAVVVAAVRALRGWSFTAAAEQPTLHRLSLPSEARREGARPAPAALRFAALALEALNAGETSKARCYWHQVGAAERGRLGPDYEALRITPRVVEARWSLARPPWPVPTTVGGDVRAPIKLHAVQAQYSPEARRARIQGIVILQGIVDREGDVVEIKVLKGLPMGLDDRAIETVCGWKYRPATLDGKPVEVYFNITISFTLT